MPCATRPLPLLLALPLGLLSALPDFLLLALSFATTSLPKPADSCTNGLMRVRSSAIFDGESPSPEYSENSKLTRVAPRTKRVVAERSERPGVQHPRSFF